jgi:hypothetical protein
MSRRKENRCLVMVDSVVPARVLAFAWAKEGVSADGAHDVPKDAPLPSSVAGRDWQLLLKPRLDVAWMPADSVCLKLVELPTDDPAELASMVELQIEKLSPMPAAQVVYGYEVLSGESSVPATVLVVMAARTAVEQRLAELERRGFVADRLDVAMVRELAKQAKQDGLWIVGDPEAIPGVVAVGWRVGGRWRQVDILRLPSGDGMGASLVSALTRVAWAAEMDGWLKSIPQVRLVGLSGTSGSLNEALAAWSGAQPEVVVARERPLIAADSARAALGGDGLTLVPAEVSQKNRQAFVDRLWMRGLGSLGAVYVVLVLAGLAWFTHKENQLDEEQVDLRGLAQHYTNAMRLRDQVLILEEQVTLRFAALDCWKAAVEKLPESMTLTSMNFIRGRTLRLDGTVDPSQREEVTKYNSDLLAVQVRNQPLFSVVKPAQVSVRGTVASWSFEAELNRMEAK